MTTALKNECAEITRKFIQWTVMNPFLDKVEKQLDREALREYLSVIKKPMCLYMVRERIKDSKYETVEQYIRDMNRIWENAHAYNIPGDFIYTFATCGKERFEKKAAKLRMSQTERYLAELISRSKRLHVLTEAIARGIDHISTAEITEAAEK